MALFSSDLLGSLWPLVSFYTVNADNDSLDFVFFTEQTPRVPPSLGKRFGHLVWAQLLWMLIVLVASLALLEDQTSFSLSGQSVQVSAESVQSSLIQKVNDAYFQRKSRE